jgi:hypothetical protein
LEGEETETEIEIEEETDIMTDTDIEINIKMMIIQADIDQEKLGQKKMIFAIIVVNMVIGPTNVINQKKKSKSK